MFVIWDEAHGEQHGRFQTREEAVVELQRRAAIPWNEDPNRAPCVGWRNCGRRYVIVEYDDTTLPWKVLSRNMKLHISAAGVQWFH
jgi:hypothetical protein